MKQTFILIGFCLFSLFLTAQSLNFSWGKPYVERPNVTIHHAFQASTGQWVAVGVVYDSEKNQDDTRGVFMLIDSMGKLTQTKYFTAESESDQKSIYNAFFTAFEAQSGGFYLVGNCGKSERQSYGWIFRIDKNGNKLRQLLFENEDVRFEKAFQNNNESLTIVGQQKGKIKAINVKKVFENIDIPAQWAGLGQILDASLDTTNQLKLIGKNEDKTTIWATNGRDSKPIVLHDSKYKPDNIEAIYTPSHHAFFFGDTYIKNKRNIWVAYPNLSTDTKNNPVGKKWIETILDNGKNTDAFITAASFSETHTLLAASVKDKRTDKMKNKIYALENANISKSIDLINVDTLGYEEDFQIMGLSSGFDGKVLVWGKDETKRAPRMVLWQWEDNSLIKTEKIALAKGDNAINCANMRFDDSELGNGNGIIEAREQGAIVFDIDSRTTVQVQATPLSAHKGISFETIMRMFKSENGRVHVFFPLSVDDNLVSGSFQITFNLLIGGQKSTCVATIKCYNPLSKGQSVVAMDLKSYPKESTNATMIRERRYLAPPNSNPKVTVIHKAKENKAKLAKNPDQLADGNWAYDFELTLDLQEGDNVIPIIFEYGNGETFRDTIRVKYIPKAKREPNLHILAIAPHYRGNDSLYFNVKDVNDFVDAAMKIEGKKPINRVLTKKLISEKDTYAENIRKAFRDIANRSKSTYNGENPIADNDIVWIFISSHGKVINERFKIIPSDYDDSDDVERNRFSVDYRDEILGKLKDVTDTILDKENKRKVIIFLDACHSGAAKSKSNADDDAASAAMNKLNSSIAGIVTLSSTTDSLLSYEDPTGKNGIFTEILLKAFRGDTIILNNNKTLKPDADGNGILLLSELWDYIVQGMPDIFERSEYLKFLRQKQRPHIPLQQLKDDIPIMRY